MNPENDGVSYETEYEKKHGKKLDHDDDVYGAPERDEEGILSSKDKFRDF